MNMEADKMYKNKDEYYTRIVNVVDELLDKKWEQIVIRICKDDFHSSTGVYCKINNVFKFFGDYFDSGEIDFEQYTNINRTLSNIANEMQKELQEQKKEVWTSFVFTLMDNGEYETEYSYEELGENEFKDTINWRYKRLGILPNEKNMKYLDL